jgi:hypothetical protein
MQHDHAPVAVGHSQMDHSKMDHAMPGHSASASKPAELTEGIPGIEGRVFTVGKISAGGIYDFIRTDRAKFGIGGLASRYVLPGDLKTEYGRDLTGFMVFGRLKLL